MIALLFISITLLASFSLVRSVFSTLSLAQNIGISVLASVLLSSWLTLSIAALFGYQFALFMVIIASTYTIFAVLPKKLTVSLPKPNRPLLFFVAGWLVLFSFLFYKTFFLPSEGNLQTLPYSYGDLPLHSTYVTYFSQQTELSLISPLFSQDHIRYPFLFDFYTALLVQMGLSLRWSLFISSTYVVIALLVLLYSICYSITKKSSTPLFASVLIFLNGGLGFLKIREDWLQSQKPLNTFITHLSVDYSNMQDYGYYWTNMITTHLLPQRGFLIGLSFLLMFISLWQHIWKEKSIRTQHIVFSSSMVGLLPFFHMHTFLVCLCLLVWFLIGLIDKKKLTIKQAIFMAIPATLGVFQLLFVASEKSFLSLDLGWLAEQVNIFTFWWRNMGLSLLLIFIPTAIFWKKFHKNDFEKLLLLPAVGIFILCNIFVFQPNPWDNMKFFSLGFVLSAITAAAVLTKYWQTPLAKIGIGALLVLTSISGILSIIFVSQNSFTVATKQDLHLAAAVTETPPESIFLTADTHNHPVPMLAGRAVVRGYRGWLWTHGIDYQQTDRDIENIYRGVTATDLLKKYSVDYVYIGPYERNQYQIDEEFFKARYRTIYQDNTTTIYKIADVNLGQLPQL